MRHFGVIERVDLEPGPGALIGLNPVHIPITGNIDVIPAWELA